MPYHPALVLLVDVRAVLPGSASSSPQGWACLPVFEPAGCFVASGTYQLPLFQVGGKHEEGKQHSQFCQRLQCLSGSQMSLLRYDDSHQLSHSLQATGSMWYHSRPVSLLVCESVSLHLFMRATLCVCAADPLLLPGHPLPPAAG